MLGTECRWSEALASNDIRSIFSWLENLTVEGDVYVHKYLPAFGCWVQRTSELTKKELLTLCFSRCRGLWMFLDRNSFTRIHMLLQRLRNLLTLSQWAKCQLCSANLWHGVGVPCVVCGDLFCSSKARRSCWTRTHMTLKQHIWLGQLVQWWSIMGLLPKFPEAQEVKRITQMWRDMEHSHRKASLGSHGQDEGEKDSFSSLIQGMMMHLNRQHNFIWTSEDGADQNYPPPNLQSLLKLVLVPCINIKSVQAILMYFIQDVANFLQCKDDLLQSFCLAFTIPSSFSQQIKAFWMFDHGHIKASMEILLSPRASIPCLSWQHRCILHALLKKKQPHIALKYLQWASPTTQTPEDAKLHTDVFHQSRGVSEAWALFKKSHTEREDTAMYFIQIGEGLSLNPETSKSILPRYNGKECYSVETKRQLHETKGRDAERPLCPLSASLYQAQKLGVLSSDKLIELVREAVMEVRRPHLKKRYRADTIGAKCGGTMPQRFQSCVLIYSHVVFPELVEEKPNSRELSLSTQALHRLSISPTHVRMAEETKHTEEEPLAVDNLQLNSQDIMSSSEDLRSVSASSFTSASSLLLLKQDHSYVFERTLTLQRISSLLADEGNQNSEEVEEEEEEDEKSEIRSFTDSSTDCNELQQTPDDATDSVTHRQDEDNEVKQHLPANACSHLIHVNKILTKELEDVSKNEDLFSFHTVSSGPSTDVNLQNTRLNVEFPSSQSESDLLPPDCETGGDSESVKQERPAEGVTSQIFTFTTISMSDCVPTREVQRKTCEIHRQEELLSSDDPPCDPSETDREALADLHESRTETTLRTGDVDNFSLCSIFAAALHITNVTNESISESKVKTDSHSKAESLMKAISGGESSDSRRLPHVQNQPYSYSLPHFVDANAKQKGGNRDVTQAENDEAAGWNGLGRTAQGAIRTGRKGKRLKRT